MHITNRIRRYLSVAAVSFTLAAMPFATVKAGPPFVGMGDSIGEGVQGADAAW